jgi:hypothetical protein
MKVKNGPVRYVINTNNIPNLCESYDINNGFEGCINIQQYATDTNFKFYINILDKVFDDKNYVKAIQVQVLITPDIIVVGWVTPANWFGISVVDDNFNLFDGRFNVTLEDAIYRGLIV